MSVDATTRRLAQAAARNRVSTFSRSVGIGPQGRTLERIAAAAPRITGSLSAFGESLEIVIRTRSRQAMSHLEHHAAMLQDELRAAAREADPADVRDALRYVESTVAAWQDAPLTKPSRGRPMSVFLRIETRLEEAARRGRMTPDLERLNEAYGRWQVALGHLDRVAATTAQGDLITISRKLFGSRRGRPAARGTRDLGKTRDIADEISHATKHAVQAAPTGDGLSALLEAGRAAAAADSETRRAFHWLTAYVKERGDVVAEPDGTAGDMWIRIGEMVAGCRRADDLSEAAGNIGRLQGALGELLARSQPLYQAARRRALQEAEELAARLGGGWQVCARPTGLMGLTRRKGSLEQFYDDAIFVVRPEPPKPGEAMLMFAGEIKSGDKSAPAVLRQVLGGQAREATGLVFFNGTSWRLRPPPPGFTARRAVVSPVMASGRTQARLRFNGEVTYDSLVMAPQQLRRVAELMLDANGKMPRRARPAVR